MVDNAAAGENVFVSAHMKLKSEFVCSFEFIPTLGLHSWVCVH